MRRTASLLALTFTLLTIATVSVASADSHEEEAATSGWFRVDTDSLGTQFWFGATHNVANLAIASDIYVVGTFAEFDIGVALSFGDIALTPMVGIGFDFGSTDVTTLIAPQLFTIFSKDKLYFESWVQLFFNSPFADGAGDDFYTRNFFLYQVNDEVSVGPQVEITYRLNSEEGMNGFDSGVSSLPIGGRINLGYGNNNTLGLFVGYETEDTGGDNIAGRFTFVRTW